MTDYLEFFSLDELHGDFHLGSAYTAQTCVFLCSRPSPIGGEKGEFLARSGNPGFDWGFGLGRVVQPTPSSILVGATHFDLLRRGG
jgi:hypothetical protein